MQRVIRKAALLPKDDPYYRESAALSSLMSPRLFERVLEAQTRAKLPEERADESAAEAAKAEAWRAEQDRKLKEAKERKPDAEFIARLRRKRAARQAQTGETGDTP